MGIKSLFGQNLKLYRKDRHLSQDELAEQVGISIKHLSSIERGLSFASPEVIDKLSLVLKLPVFVFFIENREFIYDDKMLEKLFSEIDTIIDKNLLNAIKVIKADIRQNNQDN
jgi:transcriptional regulator with XRE-family HTH domain